MNRNGDTTRNYAGKCCMYVDQYVSQPNNGHALGVIRYCPFLLPSVQVNRELYFLSPLLSLPPVNRLGERVDKAPFWCQPYVTQDSRDRIFFAPPPLLIRLFLSLLKSHTLWEERNRSRKKGQNIILIHPGPNGPRKSFLCPIKSHVDTKTSSSDA